MRFRIAYFSDAGRRRENQDSLYYATAENGTDRAVCAAVCDGMGGLAKGAYASALFAKELDGWFCRIFPGNYDEKEEMRKSLEVLAESGSRRLSAKGKEEGELMGTTCAMLVVNRGYYSVMNVGDSRVYHLRRRTLRQLTQDHTLAAFIRKNRKYAEDAPPPDRAGSVLMQCIGASCIPKPDYQTGRAKAGDLFLICSDGFWRKLDPEEIRHHLGTAAGNEGDLQGALRALAAEAYAKGETDNISAIAILCGKDGIGYGRRGSGTRL